jgi:hypothetical protein
MFSLIYAALLLSQQQSTKVAQLERQVTALQTRRTSPERLEVTNQAPLQLRTAADIAAHEEVRALQSALSSAHARIDDLQASTSGVVLSHM